MQAVALLASLAPSNIRKKRKEKPSQTSNVVERVHEGDKHSSSAGSQRT